jgi:hypothetical protein
LPIVLAGNRSAMGRVSGRLSGREVIVTDNVMPEFNVLDIEPARAAIRDVFIVASCMRRASTVRRRCSTAC